MTSIETLLFGRGIRSLKPGLLIYNEVRQDRKDRLARGALDAPDGEPAQANPGIMGVSGQTPTTGAGRLVYELKAQGEEKGEDTLEKRLPVSPQAAVGGFVSQINGDSAVFSYWFGRR